MKSYGGGTDWKLFKLMQAIHADTKLVVLVNETQSEWFQMTTGSSQGDRYHLKQFPVHERNNGSS